MRNFKSETIIIKKDTWKVVRNYDRTRQGFSELSDDALEKSWSKLQWRNGGANPMIYPIANDEIRISKDSFTMSMDTIKSLLTSNGFDYRVDGFIVEGIDI